MPLSEKGQKILNEMRGFYESKGKTNDEVKRIFYASIAAGKIKGAEGKGAKKK